MRTKCVLFVSVMVVLAFSLCVQATPITVVNPGFEEPAGAGNTWNWNDRDATGVDVITGWSHDVSEDTGTWAGDAAPGGARSTFVLGGGATGPYQDLGQTIVAGQNYAFTMDIHNVYGYGGTGILVLNAHDGATRSEIARLEFAFSAIAGAGWVPHTVQLTALSGEAYIGKSLGIEFNTLADGANTWHGYDNARAEIVIVHTPDPADGEPAAPIATDLSWDGLTPTGRTFSVYFDPNQADVEARVGSTLKSSGTADLTVLNAALDGLGPDGKLEYETTYYWVVDTYDPNTTPPNDPILLPGDVWSFTTALETPVINTQPQSWTAVSVDLFVAASNAEVYEWYKVGTPDALVQTTGTLGVPGDPNNTYTTGVEDYYYCIVKNTAGSDTSETVRVMTPRLVGHWKLDSNLDDSSVAGIWGGDYIDPNELATQPLPGDVVYVTGADGIGQAAKFNGNLMVQIPDSNEFFNFHPQGLTLTAWLLGPSGGDWYRPIDKTESYGVVQHDSNSINVQFDGSGWNTVIPAAEGSEGKWRFIAMTYDPGTAEWTRYGIYDDNDVLDVLHSSVATDPATGSGTAHLRIGGRSPGTSYNYEGSVDDVRVYNYALTASQIQGVYTEMLPTTPLCTEFPEMDTTGPDGFPDCVVDIFELVQVVEVWLECGIIPASLCN